MFDLLTKYESLKRTESAREDLRKEARAALAERLVSIDLTWPDLDKHISLVRSDIQGEVEALGGTYEVDGFQVEIQQRPSWEIVNGRLLAQWLDNQSKGDLYDFSFKKADVNKICTGFSIAGMDPPIGIDKKVTPTLVITLPKHDPEYQRV